MKEKVWIFAFPNFAALQYIYPMKKVIGILVLCFWAVLVQAQYHVLHVDGIVVEKKSNETVKTGQVLSRESFVALRSRDARICVLNPTEGLMVTKAFASDQKPVTAPFELLSGLLQKVKTAQSYPIKPFLENKDDLTAYLKRGNFLFLGPTGIRVSPTEFPLDARKHFFVRFFWDKRNTEPSAKLGYVSDSLLFDPVAMLMMNGIPVPASEAHNFKLIYYPGNKTYVDICSFNAIFPDFERLDAEAKALLALLQTNKNLKVNPKQAVHDFVSECFGNADDLAFEQWFSTHLQQQ